MTDTTRPLNPPERLLCGPGPSNVEPAALAAMQRPLLGHLDPDLHEILTELVALLRDAYRASAGLVLPLQATGTSGMEAGLAHLLEPGEVAIIGVNGFFGRRIVEIARRLGAEVVEVAADWGEHVPNEALLEALEAAPGARLMAVVHAETSTGAEHPLAQLGAELRGRDVLLMADCVTSLGGVELDFDAWGIDYAYSCSQKCLGAPPGMSPVAVSERALGTAGRQRHPVPDSAWICDCSSATGSERPPLPPHRPGAPHRALHEALRRVLRRPADALARHRAPAAAPGRADLTRI